MHKTMLLTTTLTALALMVFGLLMTGCAPQTATCSSGMTKIGSVCCYDTDANGQCDPAASAPTTPTADTSGSGSAGSTGTTGSGSSTSGSSGAATDTADAATTLKPRALIDIQDALERYLNYYVVFAKDEIPANHYEDADNGIFTIYGSSTIDLLVVKDQKDWFSNFDEFEALMTRYAANRKEFTRARLEKMMIGNKTFTHWVSLEQLAMPGAAILEYRDSAQIVLHGTNDMGAPYADPVEPFGVVTLLVPCKPNVVIAFTSTRQPSRFVGNYEGEEYRSELEKALNELSTEQQYKARKVLSTCKMD